MFMRAITRSTRVTSTGVLAGKGSAGTLVLRYREPPGARITPHGVGSSSKSAARRS
jgi:hypothetical protein